MAKVYQGLHENNSCENLVLNNLGGNFMLIGEIRAHEKWAKFNVVNQISGPTGLKEETTSL
jgi:hypothetical protein